MGRVRSPILILAAAAVSAMLITVVIYAGFQPAAVKSEVIYPVKTKLYGLNSQVTSAYNLVVNISSNSTVEGAWSTDWHIMPDAGPNTLIVNSTTSPPEVVPLVNHTGPAQVELIANHFPPPPSYYPTNGSFRITVTFVAGGGFRLSGYCTLAGPTVYRFNPDIIYPHAELKYGLLFSFVFVYAPAWMNTTNFATPYLNVTQAFAVVRS